MEHQIGSKGPQARPFANRPHGSVWQRVVQSRYVWDSLFTEHTRFDVAAAQFAREPSQSIAIWFCRLSCCRSVLSSSHSNNLSSFSSTVARSCLLRFWIASQRSFRIQVAPLNAIGEGKLRGGL